MAIASEEGGSGRWSLDHLFLDQDGVPTLVEVKRGTDTRIRREVVGQMLDYAANAVLHWPLDAIRARFSARCLADGDEPETALGRLLRPESDADDFWKRVGANLAAGRIRLLFVADLIPPELRRVVEFLNRQKREELRRRLNAIEGIVLGENAVSKRPTIRLDVLVPDGRLARFLGVMDWYVAELRGPASPAPLIMADGDRPLP